MVVVHEITGVCGNQLEFLYSLHFDAQRNAGVTSGKLAAVKDLLVVCSHLEYNAGGITHLVVRADHSLKA